MLLLCRVTDSFHVSENDAPVAALQILHELQVVADFEVLDWLLLEEDLQLLGLSALQDVWLQMFENSHTDVNLVVGTHQHTGGDVLADFCPVQIVPETLSQPVEAHL